eukprot:2140224-Ditylum_brightwellii.AAC.1
MEAQLLQGIAVGKIDGSDGLYSSAKHDPHSSPPELYPSGTEVSFQRQDGVHIRGTVLSVPVKHGSHTPPNSTSQNYII